MQELLLTLYCCAAGDAFDREQALRSRLPLFAALEQHALRTPRLSGASAALRVEFEVGSRFILHSVVVRALDERDLFRWRGVGELFGESAGLRFAQRDVGVMIEAVAPGAGFTIGLDCEACGEEFELLLSVAADPTPVDEARIAHLERELKLARAAAAAEAKRSEAMINSTSWRITKPLRVLMRLATGRQSVRGIVRQLCERQRARRTPGAPVAPRAVGPPPSPAPTLPRPGQRPAPSRVSFPLDGALASVGELLPAPPAPLAATISVVIPTFNAGTEFHWLLRKLKSQRGVPPVQIVVVDSGSTDGTAELAETFGCTVVRIDNSAFSHSYARNLGADHARGDLCLFMVQDAYPVGDYWLNSLASALIAPGSTARKISAVSAAEYPRVDSELLYNAAIDTHSRFLGCWAQDRVGARSGDDHASLRAQGQLNDVTCLITMELFQQYRYRGRYAEDLDLGVRLLKDGLHSAMLTSVRVIHSHNRRPLYHLKRTFVDVVFLTEIFADYPLPVASSPAAIVTCGSRLLPLVESWAPARGRRAVDELRGLAARIRETPVTKVGGGASSEFDFPALASWLTEAARTMSGDHASDALQLRNMFADRLEHLSHFVERSYGPVDDHLASELQAAAMKTLAASIGAQLSFLYVHLSREGSSAQRSAVAVLRDLMTAGV